MKRIFGIAFLLSLIICSCGSKTESDQNKGGNDSLPMVEGDTLIIGGDTVIAVKNDSLQAKAQKAPEPPQSSKYIVVDKPKLKLYVIDGNDTLFTGGICCARNFGNKQHRDDRRTPEGEFKIANIHDASGWLYEGRIPHVYGPWFLRLDAGGWDGIGIHGTNSPGSIGHRRSKGCIRMKNEDIVKVKDLAFVGMKVIVVADNNKSLRDADYAAAPKKSTSEKAAKKEEAKEASSKDAAKNAEATAPAVEATPAAEQPVEAPAKAAEPAPAPTPAPAPAKAPEEPATI